MTEHWRPSTLEELRSFIDNGLASETRWIEFKRELPRNRDVARHLAGLAVEGGALVIGVEEDAHEEFAVIPIPLAGLREKVEQIAQSRVDPPLWVESRTLLADDSRSGVLWIDVPQSPDAPHQVDGTYYERGDTQSRPMRDAAVSRLIGERSSSPDDIRLQLHEALEEGRQFPWIGRTCIVARPVGAREQELYDSSGGQAKWPNFAAEVARARSAVRENAELHQSLLESGQTIQLAQEYQETINSAILRIARLQCPIGSSWGVLENDGLRNLRRAPEARDYASLRLGDDGSISYVTYCEFPDARCVQPGLTIAACLDVVAAILLVGSTTANRRIWDLAIGVTDARDREAMPLFPKHGFLPGVRFRSPKYERALRANGQRLQHDSMGIARDLTQRFIESCGLGFREEASALGL